MLFRFPKHPSAEVQVLRDRVFISTVLTVVLLLALGQPARADVPLPKLSLTVYGGPALLDDSYEVDGFALAGGFRAAFIFSQRFGLEGSYGKVLGDGQRTPTHSYPVDQWGLDVIYQFRPEARLKPYAVLGWAQLNLDTPPATNIDMPGWEAGAGVKYRLKESRGARMFGRAELRGVFTENVEPLEGAGGMKSHWFLTVGLNMSFGNLDEADTDRDGVPDRFDNCPDTITGAEVDPFGCPLDYDQDGVFDGLDECPSTPVGAVVDEVGCPSDADGDGVMDGIDLCNDTMAGVLVDEAGCALDTDGDGVFDGLDQCPQTPARVRVDQHGCAVTSTVSAYETTLRDTGSLVLANIDFKPGTAEIQPESFPVLDELGSVLTRWPDLELEIGGHTDGMGDDQNNLQLSEDRAKAVVAYLTGRFASLDPGRYQPVGFGEARPVAGNDTDDGRAQNRRITFTVLNPSVWESER